MMPPKQWLTLSDGSILTRQEQFVLRQVAAGEIADLKQEFGEAEEDRRLRARFLEELLTGELQGVKIHRRGVRIRQCRGRRAAGSWKMPKLAVSVELNDLYF